MVESGGGNGQTPPPPPSKKLNLSLNARPRPVAKGKRKKHRAKNDGQKSNPPLHGTVLSIDYGNSPSWGVKSLRIGSDGSV
jgi:hypothetical protein